MTTLHERLKEIESRLEAATSGPWYSYETKVRRTAWDGVAIGVTPSKPVMNDGSRYPSPDFSKNVIGVDGECFAAKLEDCDLIAQAPSDLKLLLEVVRLQAEAINWYADHDPEMTSEYYRAGLWRRARETQAAIAKLLSEEGK